MSFQKSLDMALEVEKGFVNHALDRGGPTNLGITLRTLSKYIGRAASIEELKALTPAAVAPIYKSLYWDPVRLDHFPENLAAVVFNQVILRGEVEAVKSLQAALKLFADGKVGPKTIEAVRSVDERQLIFDFLRQSHTAYIRICQSDASQLVFLAGWSNRIFDLLARNLR